eukprot:RCo001032
MEGPSGSALQQDASTNDGLCSKCSRPLALGASAHIQCTTQGPVTCKACNTPITRGGVYAMEGSIYHAFHARCFKCDKCGNPIEDRVEWVDGKKLHPRCVKKTCEHCGLEIADSVVVNGKTYHPEHFLCKTCKMPIFGRYYTHQNNYYCGKACAKGVIRAQQQLRPPPFASLYVMAHTLKPGTVPWPAEGVSLLVDVANRRKLLWRSRPTPRWWSATPRCTPLTLRTTPTTSAVASVPLGPR